MGRRLTPERALFEWALLDANKSGTAEKFMVFVSLNLRGGGFFYGIFLRQMERIVSHMKNFDKYRPGYYMPPETCLD